MTLENITLADIENLVRDGIREDKAIEYKRAIPQDRAELLKDVSAFANMSGGDLIFGIEEEKGVPLELRGCRSRMLILKPTIVTNHPNWIAGTAYPQHARL